MTTNYRKLNRRKQRGMATIEFSVGFGAFFLMCITWAEIGYLAHVSAVTDVAIAEAAREAKTTSVEHDARTQSFMSVFKRVVSQETERYGGVVDSDRFRFTVQYLDSIDALESYQGDCRSEEDTATGVECGSAKLSALALYAVEYDYTPMFSQVIAKPSILRREVIVVQEYERDAFTF